MNDNLPPLPCPFCGEQPQTTERPDNIDGTQFFFALACYCGSYHANAHKMAIRKTPEQAKADAIGAWNARAAIERQSAAPQPCIACGDIGGHDKACARVRWGIDSAPQPQPVSPLELSEYDAGLLNDFGGGNVEWWQDYIRAELCRAYEYYQSQIPAQGEKQ